MAYRPLYQIAQEIKNDWSKQKGGVNYAAEPYLDAMFALENMTDRYGADNAKSMVLYFLSNATTWRGEVAKRIKKELNAMCQGKALKEAPSMVKTKKCPKCGKKMFKISAGYLPTSKSRAKSFQFPEGNVVSNGIEFKPQYVKTIAKYISDIQRLGHKLEDLRDILSAPFSNPGFKAESKRYELLKKEYQTKLKQFGGKNQEALIAAAKKILTKDSTGFKTQWKCESCGKIINEAKEIKIKKLISLLEATAGIKIGLKEEEPTKKKVGNTFS